MDPVIETITATLRTGPRSTPELVQATRASASTVLRGLSSLEGQGRVMRMGRARRARYALRRTVANIGAEWPVYRIDEAGEPQRLGTLEAIEANSYYSETGPARIQGFFEGIPYYLQDARPGGFLGRAVPAAHAELQLPPRVVDWSDPHFLIYLTQRATDTTGALIVGSESMDRYLSGAQQSPVVSQRDRATQYPIFANLAMAGSPPGSSAQGEQPKFTAFVSDRTRSVAVLVKFSPPYSTAVGRRWADLLICEHLAHRVLDEAGITSCRSELLDCGERIFLESERFDRVGAQGRLGVVSLWALDVCRYGKLDSWTASAERLSADELVSAEDTDHIRLLDAFGALTANTDRHFGNITLFDDYTGPFRLAPAYDMLPMLFAPQNDQIVARQFEPPSPRAAWLPVWSRARALAETYWNRLIAEERLSGEFRQLCSSSLEAMKRATARRAAVS